MNRYWHGQEEWRPENTNCNDRQFKEATDFNGIRSQKTGPKAKHTPEKPKYRPLPNQKCKYYSFSHPPQHCLAYVKTFGGHSKMKHFQAEHKSREGRRGTVHDIEFEQNTVADKYVDTVNINSFHLNSI